MVAKSKLAVKLSAFVLLVLVLIFSLFVYYSVTNIRKNMMDIYLDKAQAIAYAIDSGVGSKEVLNDKSLMLSQIQKMMWLQEDIVNININLPENGTLVNYMSNDYVMIRKNADDANLAVYNSGSPSSVFFNDKTRNEPMLKVISPIHLSGKIGGTFEIIFTLENIDNVVQSIIKQYLLIAVFLSLAVLVLIFILLQEFVLSPIRELSKGVKSISDGNFTYKVEPKSKDEIGVLADSFNQMAHEILLSKNLLQKHQQELESQVIKRTKELQNTVDELEKMDKLTVGRELKMVELKKRIEELENESKRKIIKKIKRSEHKIEHKNEHKIEHKIEVKE